MPKHVDTLPYWVVVGVFFSNSILNILWVPEDTEHAKSASGYFGGSIGIFLSIYKYSHLYSKYSTNMKKPLSYFRVTPFCFQSWWVLNPMSFLMLVCTRGTCSNLLHLSNPKVQLQDTGKAVKPSSRPVSSPITHDWCSASAVFPTEKKIEWFPTEYKSNFFIHQSIPTLMATANKADL